MLTERKTIVWLISELYGPKNQALFVGVTDISHLPLFGYLLMGLLNQIYGFFGIHSGKIWHAALSSVASGQLDVPSCIIFHPLTTAKGTDSLFSR